jgi:ferredoxin
VSFLDDGGADVELARPGWPKVDAATLATTGPGVFVAGDLAHGTRLVIDAVASGKAAARSVYEYITGRKLHAEVVTSHQVLHQYQRERGYESIRRAPVPVAAPDARLQHPEALVEIGYTPEQAVRESSRCLDCGVTPVFDGGRCVLCGGCADVCPTQCLKLTPLEQLAGDADFDAALARDCEEIAWEAGLTDENVCPTLKSSDFRAGGTGGSACRRSLHSLASLLGTDYDLAENSAILKDEDRCIRCALCAMRCPVDAITMERVTFHTHWKCA